MQCEKHQNPNWGKYYKKKQTKKHNNKSQKWKQSLMSMYLYLYIPVR
jgi:hypothetical protein